MLVRVYRNECLCMCIDTSCKHRAKDEHENVSLHRHFALKFDLKEKNNICLFLLDKAYSL